ncbi:bifunctional folylpolyglutamate synthase/dihydrofolate synthase [Terracoccus luteus]|uniref:Dihydrofolate synthase/folylpolyglutamate synthase n=1 Tax=Terracoccus luteus TaxID=53356 RepID=A0A839PPY0_9MICO|nr:folylpolyglutamate synthase/dihydrofolate synthase family protein [Terracoccus luteus]MBB2985149.1 dihydrofolate synthase/folylpolyglutamate synthase [Terracoccus luteus]MCP2170801.1 dihydrofolate synthase/folylpolyglutamate synthase [Terracoccus luteus]
MSPSGRPDAAAVEAAHTLEAMKRMREVEEEILARAPENDVGPSLERIRAVMELAGDPQRQYPVVHLTGTNGKTSTSRMVDTILTETGLTTGRFTSPHLHDIRERISIGGKPVSRERFVAAYEEVLPLVELVDARSLESGGRRLNFFEVLVAVAFAAFADAPVDVAVIEVGLGGSWDATNVADGQVAVITPIDLDHTHLLGDDVRSIAEEKSGIIKADAIAVVGPQENDAVEVLATRAEEVGARLVVEGTDYGVTAREVAIGGQQVSLRGLAAEYPDLFLPLHGEHQAANLATAVAAAEAFLGGGTQPLDEELLRSAVGRMTSPGRLEVVRRSPTVLVDAAHNPHGARSLVAAMGEAFAFTRLVGLVGIVADKDAVGILEVLEPALDHLVVTRSSSPRALSPTRLGELATELYGEGRVTVVDSLPDALETAVTLAEQDGLGGGVVATGSVITAAEVRMLLGTTDV